MQLSDTEHVVDGDHSLINCKLLILYFRCWPRHMKYAYEAMRFITCVKASYSDKTVSVPFRQFYFSVKPGSRNWKIPLKITFLISELHAKWKIPYLFSRFHSRLWTLKLVPHFSEMRWTFFRIPPRYYLSQFSQVIALFHFSRKSQNKKFVEFFQLFATFIEGEKCQLFCAFLQLACLIDSC